MAKDRNMVKWSRLIPILFGSNWAFSTFHRNSEVLPLTEEQKSAIVRAHNVYRNAVSPKAANMNAILWSEQLSLR